MGLTTTTKKKPSKPTGAGNDKAPPNLAAAPHDPGAPKAKVLPKQMTILGTTPLSKVPENVEEAAHAARRASKTLNKARDAVTRSRAHLEMLMSQSKTERVEGIDDDNKGFGFALKEGKAKLEEYTIDKDE